jgi:hypothetical protein
MSNKNKNKKLNIRTLNKILATLIIILGVYYIAGINDLTVKGFELQKLKMRLADIKNDNNNLELQMMSLGSYNNLSERIKGLDMVAVGKVEYISTVGSVVAKK